MKSVVPFKFSVGVPSKNFVELCCKLLVPLFPELTRVAFFHHRNNPVLIGDPGVGK